MKAKSVEECWHIAFTLAEEYQNEMNNTDNKALFILFQHKRDVASDIAWRIKHGEKKEMK